MHAPPPPGRRRVAAIPGPAGAIDSVMERANGWGGGGSVPACSQGPPPDRSAFKLSAAWKELAAQMSDLDDGDAVGGAMSFNGRQTLADLRYECTLGGGGGRPPPAPVISGTLCVLIKALDSDQGSGDDVPATLADETGEFSATLHAQLFVDRAPRPAHSRTCIGRCAAGADAGALASTLTAAPSRRPGGGGGRFGDRA